MDGFFMQFTDFLRDDRRLLVLLLNIPLALIIGFATFSADQSLRSIIYGGFWIMLLFSGLFVWSLWRIAMQDWKGWSGCRECSPWPAVLVGFCGALLLVHEQYGFKILMDEAMLLGTSMSLHFDKIALVPMRGHDIQGAFEVMGGELDKRPLFQPFLVSLVHDFTGYRPENAFALNSVLTFVLLGLAYRVGARLAGRGAGVVVVLLLTGLPLLSQNATGGGFEILNLVMILSVFALGLRFVVKRDALSQEAMVLAAVLLAYTRYESVLFLLPVGLLMLWVWWQEKRPVLSWTVLFAPLLMVPYVLHNKVFSVRSSSWELASQPGYEKPFSLSYIPDNIPHWLNFFFDHTGEHSNSLVLSVLGWLALPFFALWVIKKLASARTADPVQLATAIFALGFAAHSLLLLCYFWGRFDDPVIRRLSLPLNLFLALAVVSVATNFAGGNRRWQVLASLGVLGLFAHSLPAMARHDYTLDYYVGREMEWRREFIAAHPEKDYLVIDKDSIFWITHRVSATPVKQALNSKGILHFNFQNRIFSAFYVFQRLTVNPQTGEFSIPEEDDLGPDYHLETVWERRFTPLTVSRISRVVSIAEGPVTMPEAPTEAMTNLTPQEREEVREAYLQNFIKKLP
jgi:hypothetical protein